MREARQQILVRWYEALKARLVCGRCGESHPACLQFHHRDASTKDQSISDAVKRGWSIARLTREIDKCDVVCANCHIKEHARRRGEAAQ